MLFRSLLRGMPRYLLIISIFFAAATCSAASKVSPLEVSKVFSVSAKMYDHQTILLQWKIAPGYYLYKDRIKVTPIDNTLKLAKPLWPQPIWREDSISGRYAAYGDNISVSFPILDSSKDKLKLAVFYQGCSASGFCYPPQVEKIILNRNSIGRLADVEEVPQPDFIMFGDSKIPASDIPQENKIKKSITTNVVKQGENSLLNLFGDHSTTSLSNILKSSNYLMIGVVFFCLGVLLSLTPCVLPMIPILLGILAGSAKQGENSSRRVLLSVCYVLGMAFSYALIGLMFGHLGENIQLIMQKPLVIILIGFFFVCLAFSLFGFYTISLPGSAQGWLQNITNRQTKGSLFGALVMGCVASLIASPCVTPPLVAVLLFISNQASPFWGAFILFTMGLGMGLPLIILGILGAKFMPRTGSWMVIVKNTLAFMLLAVAVWLWQRVMPVSISMLLWCLLSWAIAITIIYSCRKYHPSRITIIIATLITVFLLVIGAWSAKCAWKGQVNWRIVDKAKSVRVDDGFIKIKNVADLKQKLSIAKEKKQPVIIDYYANWCVECKLLKRNILSQGKVQLALRKYMMLQIDITANSVEDKKLMRLYGVIAPPTFIFYAANGKLLAQHTIIGGEISAEQFLVVLRQIVVSG